MESRWPRKKLDIDGTTLAYVERGDPNAEPIVLLHGYIGSHLTWRHHIEPLAQHHRVLAPDWFGWGESGRSLDLCYDFDSEVDRLGRVFNAFGLASCNLFGFDYGGLLALGLCERHPQRVRRLALLNSRAHGRLAGAARQLVVATVGARTPLVRSLIAHLPLTTLNRIFVRRDLAAGVFDEQILDHYIGWMSHDPNGGRFWVRFFSGYKMRTNPELARGLPSISCPTAIIWGRQEPWLPAATPSELAATIPNARLTMLDARHFVIEERPREVLAALEALLARPVGARVPSSTDRADAAHPAETRRGPAPPFHAIS